MPKTEEFDVESLIGKEIDYTWKSEGQKCKAIIAGIAESVGWTLVRADDTDDEICCWNGPLSPHASSNRTFMVTNAWDTVVGMLRNGYYDSDKAFEVSGHTGGGGGLECAFR